MLANLLQSLYITITVVLDTSPKDFLSEVPTTNYTNISDLLITISSKTNNIDEKKDSSYL